MTERYTWERHFKQANKENLAPVASPAPWSDNVGKLYPDYCIYDAKHSTIEPIAVCFDSQTAELIVNTLNGANT